MSCGYNTIVVGEYGSGRNVYLGYLYMASDRLLPTPSLRSGDWDRLLEQAVAWSADALDSDGDGVSQQRATTAPRNSPTLCQDRRRWGWRGGCLRSV